MKCGEIVELRTEGPSAPLCKGTLQMGLRYEEIEMGDYPGLAGGPSVITRVLIQGKQEAES